jgi:hypothetical protein
MLKTLALIAALAVPSAALAQASPPPEPVRVMIVGTVHFDNPGQDLNNATMDPVTTPAKQAELAAVAAGLARFHPTAVAVEREAADPSTLLDQRYPAFTPDMLLTNPDERYQVAYRLAHNEGLDRVYAIDEQGGEGRRDYFPFGKVSDWFTAHHREAGFEALNSQIAAYTADLEVRQRTVTIGALLADTNRPDHPVHGSLGFYYGLLTFGDGVDQPGAELNAGWYERNARIFVKLMSVARPGDRIVVVFGAGHAYWLRHFVQNTPGFELVDPVPYLTGT